MAGRIGLAKALQKPAVWALLAGIPAAVIVFFAVEEDRFPLSLATLATVLSLASLVFTQRTDTRTAAQYRWASTEAAELAVRKRIYTEARLMWSAVCGVRIDERTVDAILGDEDATPLFREAVRRMAKHSITAAAVPIPIPDDADAAVWRSVALDLHEHYESVHDSGCDADFVWVRFVSGDVAEQTMTVSRLAEILEGSEPTR